MSNFVDKASIVASAVSPVEIGLAYCQVRSTPIIASCVKGFSIIVSPIDTVIQIAVVPIWIIYDDVRSNSTMSDWVLTPLRLPVKMLLGALFGIITQFLENIQRIKDIYSCDSGELYYQYKGKWLWIIQGNQQQSMVSSDDSWNQSVTIIREGITIQSGGNGAQTLAGEMLERIGEVVLPLLRDKNYTHWYIYRQIPLTPPSLFSPSDGAFSERLMPNDGQSSFLLYFHESGMNLHQNISFFQPEAQRVITEQRTGIINNHREYRNLYRYNLLPFHVMEKLRSLPVFNGNFV